MHLFSYIGKSWDEVEEDNEAIFLLLLSIAYLGWIYYTLTWYVWWWMVHHCIPIHSRGHSMRHTEVQLKPFSFSLLLSLLPSIFSGCYARRFSPLFWGGVTGILTTECISSCKKLGCGGICLRGAPLLLFLQPIDCQQLLWIYQLTINILDVCI